MNPNSTDQKIAIVGAGKMGSAMLKALATHFPQTQAYDTDTDLNKVLPNADIIIFAVKPQDFDNCCQDLAIDLSKKLVISIMAGVSIKKISTQTKAKRVVRSMPNLPLQVNAGITAWLATKELNAVNDKILIKKIFSCFGEEIEVKKESDLDKITALSGSGPAYFFYLCETLADKAKKMGFSDEDAEKIADATFIGSAKLLDAAQKSAKEFREAVTSKGGTTEAALKHLQKHKFDQTFCAAIDAAAHRSKELLRLNK